MFKRPSRRTPKIVNRRSSLLPIRPHIALHLPKAQTTRFRSKNVEIKQTGTPSGQEGGAPFRHMRRHVKNACNSEPRSNRSGENDARPNAPYIAEKSAKVVHYLPDQPQRILRQNLLLKVGIGKHRPRRHIRSTYLSLRGWPPHGILFVSCCRWRVFTGLLVASSGNVTDEHCKKYIEDQKPRGPDDNFRVV